MRPRQRLRRSAAPPRRPPISSIKEMYSRERSASMISLCFLYFLSSWLLMVKDTVYTLRPELR